MAVQEAEHPVADGVIIGLCGDENIHYLLCLKTKNHPPGKILAELVHDPEQAYEFARSIISVCDRLIGVK